MLESYTTEVLFNSQPPLAQLETIKKWMHYRQEPSVGSTIDVVLTSKTFAMPCVCAALPSHEEHKELLTKALKNVSEKQYALFKYEGLKVEVEHKESKAVFDALDKKVAKISALENEAAYQKLPGKIRELMFAGQTKEYFTLTDSIDLRRMPLSSSEQLSYPVTKASNTALWPPALHLICKDEVSEEVQKIFITSMINNGYNVRHSLCCNLEEVKQYKDLHNFLQKDTHEIRSTPIWLGISLLIAFKNKSFNILKHLWSEPLAELWERPHLELILDLCFQEQEWEVAKDILNTELSRNIFASFGNHRH
jgi:hypothetical protein